MEFCPQRKGTRLARRGVEGSAGGSRSPNINRARAEGVKRLNFAVACH
jgi:hypothetical protein